METPLGEVAVRRVTIVTVCGAPGETSPKSNPSAIATDVGPAEAPPARGWSSAMRDWIGVAVSTPALYVTPGEPVPECTIQRSGEKASACTSTADCPDVAFMVLTALLGSPRR